MAEKKQRGRPKKADDQKEVHTNGTALQDEQSYIVSEIEKNVEIVEGDPTTIRVKKNNKYGWEEQGQIGQEQED